MSSQTVYAILIDKFGKREFNTKERLFLFIENEIRYYTIPNDKETREILRKNKKELKSENDNPSEGKYRFENWSKLPKTQKDSMDWKEFGDSIWEHNSNDGNIYTIRSSKQKTKVWKWEMSETEARMFEKLYKTVKHSNDLNKEKEKNQQNDTKKEAERQPENTNKSEPTDFEIWQNWEIIYQSLLAKYFSSANKSFAKRVELELSIELIIKKFTEYCERLAQIIWSYWNAESLSEKGAAKFIPIMLPDFKKALDQDRYLIYYFFGITITVTWNCIDYKEHSLFGIWDDVKDEYRQAENTQNHILNLSKQEKTMKNMSQVPLTCLIDYCGFRFLFDYNSENENEKIPSNKRNISKKFKDLFYNVFQDVQTESKSQMDYEKKDTIGSKNSFYDKFCDIINDFFFNRTIKENKEGLQDQVGGGQNNNQITFEEDLDDIPLKHNYFSEYRKLKQFPDLTQPNISLDFNRKKMYYFRTELLDKNPNNDTNKKSNQGEEKSEDNIDNKPVQFQEDKKYERAYNIFINSLDSFFYKVYSSENMVNLCHENGVNCFSLGQIWEKAETPYIKEFCLIEMIARICKKIIFHLLATNQLFHFIETVDTFNTSNMAPLNSDEINAQKFPFVDELPKKFRQKCYNQEKSHDKNNEKNQSWTYLQTLKDLPITSYQATQNSNIKFYAKVWASKSEKLKGNGENIKTEIVNISKSSNQQGLGNNQPPGNRDDKKIIWDNHIGPAKEVIAKFLNIWFNKTKERLTIKGKEYSHKDLWKYISELCASYFKIESRESLIFCKLKCLSIPPFLEAWEYHTGIEWNWQSEEFEKEQTTNTITGSTMSVSSDKSEIFNYSFFPKNTNNIYTNRYIWSKFWKESDIWEIKPKIKTFSFHKFDLHVDLIKEYQCNFSQLIINRNTWNIDALDEYMWLRYHHEKIKKINNFSTWWYIYFFIKLKHDEMSDTSKDVNREEIQTMITDIGKQENNQMENEGGKEGKKSNNFLQNKKVECKELYKSISKDIINKKDHNSILFVGYEDSKGDMNYEAHYAKIKKKFERLAFLMVDIAKEIQTVAIPHDPVSQSPNNNLIAYQSWLSTQYQMSPIEIKEQKSIWKSETQAIELVSNYYYKSHPYISDIKELCAKEFLKKWKKVVTTNKGVEDWIKKYFDFSVENGLMCLPRNNWFLGNIGLDVGTFFAFLGDYLNAIRVFNWAYVPFKQNSQDFPKDYFMFLKRCIKYNIKWRDFKTALLIGDEWWSEITIIRNDKDNTITNYLNKHWRIDRITYNLALLTLKTKEYDRGIKHCQNIFVEKKTLASNQNTNALIGERKIKEQNEKKQKKSDYISWQKTENDDYPGKGLERDGDFDTKREEAEYILKLKWYLKMIIRSWKDEKKVIYLQALLRMYDSSEEKKKIQNWGVVKLQQIKDQLIKDGELNEYFNKLKINNRDEDASAEKLNSVKEKEESGNFDWFRLLFVYFKKDKVFYSFEDAKNRQEQEKTEGEVEIPSSYPRKKERKRSFNTANDNSTVKSGRRRSSKKTFD